MTAPVSANLPAGRELDALVAERVMGFAHSECRMAEEDVWVSDDGVLWFQLPHYSTDIAAAWEVVEKLNNRGEWVTVGLSEAHTAKCFIGDSLGYAEAETAPLAICRAALKAVEP